MKKFSFVLIISLSLLFLGCSSRSIDNGFVDNRKKVEGIEVEDNQKEIGRIDAEVEVFEFNKAVAKSDLIAQVEILDVLKETDEPSPKTIFRAALIENLKGSAQAKEIFVMQQGNRDFIFNDNPLFIKGENYLLFLMESEGLDIENSYWILGEETNMYKLFDDAIAVKMSLKEDELSGIEISDEKIMSFIEKNKELNINEREMQILKQGEFKKLIKNISGEGK